MKKWTVTVTLLTLFLAFTEPTPSVRAFEASSTSFYVRQDMADIAGRSTSTNFWLFNNGSQNGIGLSTSTSFGIFSGIIRALFQPIAPAYNQIHYHWRNDNGTETTATSATSGNQDTILSGLNTSTTIRLRMGISNTGGSLRSFSNQQFRLQYGLLSTICSAIGSWTDFGTGTATWNMSDSTNLTEGNNTTNIATSSLGAVSDGSHTFITPNGGLRDTSNQTGAISVPSDSFAELEYSIAATSTASGTYCFRTTNAGSATNFTYTQYPQATLSVGQNITLIVSPSTINMPSLSPGLAVTATSTATVTITGGTNGYSLQISRNSATSTLASSTTTFPDFASWNSGSDCSTGQGNGTTTPGQTLSFRVQNSGTTADYCSFWWGANDANGTAIYAGFPTSTQTIVNATSTNNGASTSTIVYRADVPGTQKSTNYTGIITFTALTNP